MNWQEEQKSAIKAVERGQYQEAARLAELALSAAGADVSAQAACLLILGKCQRKLAHYKEAESTLKRAVATAKEVHGDESKDYATALYEHGFALQFIDEFYAAELSMQECVKVRTKIFGLESAETAQALNGLGCALMCDKKYKEAEPHLRKALGIREKVCGRFSHDYANSLFSLATFDWYTGKTHSAEVMLKNAAAAERDARGPNHPIYGKVLVRYANVLMEVGKWRLAQEEAEKAVRIFDKALPSDHPWLVEALNAQGSAQLAGKSHRDAKYNFERALALAGRHANPNVHAVLTSRLGLGFCLLSQNDFSGAEPHFETAKKLMKTVPLDHIEGKLIKSMFQCYLLQGKFGKAIGMLPDQMRLANESRLKGYIEILNFITDLGERYAWKKDD